MATKSKRPGLKNDLEFYLDGFTVRVKRWGAVTLSGGRDDGDPGTREKRMQLVRAKVERMAADGGWNG